MHKLYCAIQEESQEDTSEVEVGGLQLPLVQGEGPLK